MEIRVQLEELAMCLEYNLFDSECVINELLEVMRTKKYQIKRDTDDYYNKYLLKLINQKQAQILEKIQKEEDKKFFFNQVTNLNYVLQLLNKSINRETIQITIRAINTLLGCQKVDDCLKLFELIKQKKDQFIQLMDDNELAQFFDALLEVNKQKHSKEIELLIKDVINKEEEKGIPGEIFCDNKSINELNKVIKITLINLNQQKDDLTFTLLKYTTIYELKYLIMIKRQIPIENIHLFCNNSEIQTKNNEPICSLSTNILKYSYDKVSDTIDFDRENIKKLLNMKYNDNIEKKNFLSSINDKEVKEIVTNIFYTDKMTTNKFCDRIKDVKGKSLIYHLLFKKEKNDIILRNENIFKMKRLLYFNRKNEYNDNTFVIYTSSDINQNTIEPTLLFSYLKIFEIIGDTDNIWIPKEKDAIIEQFQRNAFTQQNDINKCIEYLKDKQYTLASILSPDDLLKMQNIFFFIFMLNDYIQTNKSEKKMIEVIFCNNTYTKADIQNKLNSLKGIYFQLVSIYNDPEAKKENDLTKWFCDTIPKFQETVPFVIIAILQKIISKIKEDEIVFALFTKYIFNPTDKIVKEFINRDTNFLVSNFLYPNAPRDNCIVHFYERIIQIGIHNILSGNNIEEKQQTLTKFNPFLIFYSINYYKKDLLSAKEYHELILLMLEIESPNDRLALYYFLLKQKQEPEQYILFTKIIIKNVKDISNSCNSLFNYLLYNFDQNMKSPSTNQMEQAFEKHDAIVNISNEENVITTSTNTYTIVCNNFDQVNFETEKDRIKCALFKIDEELSFVIFKCGKKNHWIKYSTYFQFVSTQDINFKQLIDNSEKSYIVFSDEEIYFNNFAYKFYLSIIDSSSISGANYKQISQSLLYVDYNCFSFYSIFPNKSGKKPIDQMDTKIQELISTFIKDNSFPFIHKLLKLNFIEKNHITNETIKSLLENTY